ncbi:MAG: serine hydrolase [Elusimicrobiales bacterium]|nr:serine hydrolase [Elusimicrobiales bacterium]
MGKKNRRKKKKQKSKSIVPAETKTECLPPENKTHFWLNLYSKSFAWLKNALTPESKTEASVLLAALFLFTAYNAVKMYKTYPWRAEDEISGHEVPGEEKAPVDVLTEKEWDSLVGDLEKQVKKWPAQAGIVLKDFETGRIWTSNSDGKFRSASLIKVPIAAALMEQIEEGSISLDSSLKISRKNRVSGSGTLKWVSNGTKLPLEEVLFKMITESDNTATKMIVDEMGLDSISQSLSSLGLKHTNVCKNISNMTSVKIKDDSFTTPADIAGLFEKIYSGTLVDKEKSEYLMGILKQTKSRNRLKAGLPDGWELGHKTGLLRSACHDAGIVFSPRGNYLLVVMTGNVPNYKKAKAFIASVGRTTYKYYKPHENEGEIPGGGMQETL